MAGKSRMLFVFILLNLMLLTFGQQTCDTPEDDVQTKCFCGQSHMECHGLTKMPDLTALKNGANVTQIFITDSNLGALENSDIGVDYASVKLLSFFKCEITSLGVDAFKHAARLQKLELPGNYLTQITNVMLKMREDLKELNLAQNQIETLPETLLSEMPNLDKLDLSYNKGLKLDEEFFSEAPKLKTLNLDHTGQAEIPSKMLSYAPSLEEIDLNGNEITVVPTHAFVDLPNLRRIALDHNNIREVQEGAFEGLPNLRELVLQNNHLKELKPEVMEPIGDTLIKIYLTNNNISTLHEDVIRHDVIELIKVGHNPWVCDCKIKWMKDLELKHRDPENVTCTEPEKWRGQPISDVTEEMLCSWCDGCEKTNLAYAIGIPILIISFLLLGYFLYKFIQGRRQHSRLRKVYKYSNVYKDTVEPANVPPSQRRA